MDKITYRTINSALKINGFSCDYDRLRIIGITYIKEGYPYMKQIGNFLLSWLDNKDYIDISTSGTTGVPRAVQIKKQHMVNSALATGKYLNLKEGNTALCCLPASFIAGRMMIVRAIILGLEIDFIEPSSIPMKLTNKSYDFVAMTPMQASKSIEELHRIKKLILGGSPISNDLEEKLQSVDCQVYASYGMTETVSHIAIRKVNNRKKEKKTYKAMPHVSFEQDNRNCLVINCFKVSDKPIITNDVVELIDETEFEWKGRYDNVINSGGFKIFPENIETKLIGYIKNRYFIWHENDPILGQKAVLLIEGKEDKYPNLLEKLQEDRKLLRYEIPKNVYFVPKFILTETGKTKREETANLVITS